MILKVSRETCKVAAALVKVEGARRRVGGAPVQVRGGRLQVGGARMQAGGARTQAGGAREQAGATFRQSRASFETDGSHPCAVLEEFATPHAKPGCVISASQRVGDAENHQFIPSHHDDSAPCRVDQPDRRVTAIR